VGGAGADNIGCAVSAAKALRQRLARTINPINPLATRNHVLLGKMRFDFGRVGEVFVG